MTASTKNVKFRLRPRGRTGRFFDCDSLTGFIRETIVWLPRHGDEDWGVFLAGPGAERNDVAFAYSREEALALRDWLSEANPARNFEIRSARPPD